MAKLGEQVDIYCGRCKVERYHTVAAIGEGGRIERVVCGYCQSSRKYKHPKAVTSRRPRETRSRQAVELPTVTPPRPYSQHLTYARGDAIAHPRYGTGRVTEVRGDRVDVRFADGVTRVFLHTAG
jgi:hypothetical protein